MREKLTSRKFWICVAAFLGSIATTEKLQNAQ